MTKKEWANKSYISRFIDNSGLDEKMAALATKAE